MERDIGATLAELERKLRELERELAQVSEAGEGSAQPPLTAPAPDVPPAATYAPPSSGATYAPPSSGATYAPPSSGATYAPPSSGAQYAPPGPAAPDQGAFGAPAAADPEAAIRQAGARLIDEAALHQPPPPPPPAPPAAMRQAVDPGQLERFREKLERTMHELIDEYGRIISAGAGAGAAPPAPPSDAPPAAPASGAPQAGRPAPPSPSDIPDITWTDPP